MTVSIVAAAMIMVIAGSVAATPASAGRLEFVRAAETLVIAGNEALAEDEAYGALTLFEQAIVANPKNADGFVGLGGGGRGRPGREGCELNGSQRRFLAPVDLLLAAEE